MLTGDGNRPDRIWAWDQGGHRRGWYDIKWGKRVAKEHRVEYVRADLHATIETQLTEAQRQRDQLNELLDTAHNANAWLGRQNATLEARVRELEFPAMAWGWLAIEGLSVMRWEPGDWRMETEPGSCTTAEEGYPEPLQAVAAAIEAQTQRMGLANNPSVIAAEEEAEDDSRIADALAAITPKPTAGGEEA